MLLYSIMKYIITTIRKYLANETPKPMGNPMGNPMGRWNIEYCHKKMNHKIDLSNEDHCGPCGQYALTKNDELRIKSNTEKKR